MGVRLKIDSIWVAGQSAIAKFVLPSEGRDTFVSEAFSTTIDKIQKGLERKYSLGTDRIIQRALPAVNHEARIYVLRDEGAFSRKRAIREVIFCPMSEDEHIRKAIDAAPVHSIIQFEAPRPSLRDADGYTTINAWTIHQYVQQQLKSAGLEGPISLRDASEKVWKGLTGNIKSTLHDWMRRGPVFRPVKPVPHRDPAGCKLDLADLVAIGVVHGLITHGLRSPDFGARLPLTFFGRRKT